MPDVLRRHGLLALALLGCVLLIVAEFSDLYSVRVITATVAHGSVGGHHAYALLVVALAAAVMALGATIGASRPAAMALVVLAAAALFVVLAIDLPAVGETGRYGMNFEQARARAEGGFKLETAGAIVLLVAAVAILAFGPRERAVRARGRTPRREREQTPREERDRRRRGRVAPDERMAETAAGAEERDSAADGVERAAE